MGRNRNRHLAPKIQCLQTLTDRYRYRLQPISYPETLRVRHPAPKPKYLRHFIGWEPADKPGSVVDSHSSGVRVTARLLRPTRERPRAAGRGAGPHVPLFGLAPGGVYPAAACCHRRGALLPHHFNLTARTSGVGGIFSVALSVGSRPPGVTWHPALWSPDFPPPASGATPDRGATVWPTPCTSVADQVAARQAVNAELGNARCERTWVHAEPQ
jgi:hypothetical protein